MRETPAPAMTKRSTCKQILRSYDVEARLTICGVSCHRVSQALGQAPASAGPGGPRSEGDPGIIAARAQFTQVFRPSATTLTASSQHETASLLASQEDNNAVLKIDKDDKRPCSLRCRRRLASSIDRVACCR